MITKDTKYKHHTNEWALFVSKTAKRENEEGLRWLNMITKHCIMARLT